ncbi:MAG: BON domain-containing protein [Paludisphaera borealis]|uniref:BON domain-containing protein n=1 Tax=Paludisphaera borealis TaxID=1387353 RepID=UPI0028452E6B|nr:BON domain-containing protein [Paludisphaera borealis]MDR3620195.1 BON domain-containing protein [Paludisphaera borealis]
MIRLTMIASAVLGVVSLSPLLTTVNGQSTVSPRSSPKRPQPIEGAQAVVDALRANPLILPYAIQVTPSDGAIVLSGKVGTKQVHDMAVRTVIDLGLVPHDDLVIDTAEAHRVALSQSYNGPAPGLPASTGTAPYFVYPPPLFGRLDDPFWGFEPPILSFPPGYTRTLEPARGAAAGPIKGQVQLTVDSAGQVFLSGVVASEQDKRTIEQEARLSPGVTRVFNELQVASRTTPPPPPQPIDGAAIDVRPKAPASEPKPSPTPDDDAAARKPKPIDLVTARDGHNLTGRAVRALERRPALKELPIAVQSNDDVVTLSGKVPSAYEAMLAYRAVEQTPGVRDVIDKLEFQMPDENHPNPLKDKARPDDLEPYLTYQIRRHAGDVAHIDPVRVRGDVVEVRGTLLPDEDQARVAATLRSIPLLRDFRIEPTFSTD